MNNLSIALIVINGVPNLDTSLMFGLVTYKFKLMPRVGQFRTRNPNVLDMTIMLGCFEEKLTKLNLTTGAENNKNFVSFDGKLLVLVYARADNQSQSIQITDWFSLDPDFDGCGVKQIQAYSDPKNSNLSTSADALTLAKNPMTNPSSGLLIFNYQEKIQSQIYLVAEAINQALPVVNKTMAVKVSVCDDRPRPLVGKLQLMFLVNETRKEANISDLFSYSTKFEKACGETEVYFSTDRLGALR